MSQILTAITDPKTKPEKKKANISKLLAKGVVAADLNATDGWGQSALRHAIFNGWLDVVVEMIAQGADLDAVDGRGFNHLRAAGPHPDIMRALLQAGARPSAGFGEVCGLVHGANLEMLALFTERGLRFSPETPLGSVSAVDALEAASRMPSTVATGRLPQLVTFMVAHGLDVAALATVAQEEKNLALIEVLVQLGLGGISAQTLSELRVELAPPPPPAPELPAPETIEVLCADSRVTLRFGGKKAAVRAELLMEHLDGCFPDATLVRDGATARYSGFKVEIDDVMDHLLDMSDSADPKVLDGVLRKAVARAGKSDGAEVAVGS